MKKIIFLLLVSFMTMNSLAQQNRIGRSITFPKDIFDNLRHNDNKGFEAILTKNIFDDIIYEDNKNNKLTYKKKFVDGLRNRDRHLIFDDLIKYFKNREGVKETFEIDVFDNLKYTNNKGFEATLSKNVSKDIEYEDSNKNRIIFRQKFIRLFDLYDIANLDVYLFMDMFYTMMGKTNYKEVYEVDIFDNVKYTSSDGVSIKMEKDQAMREYKHKMKRKNHRIWKDFFQQD